MNVISIADAEPIKQQVDKEELRIAFQGAQIIDLGTCSVSSVVILRKDIGIKPPSIPVYLKMFDKKRLPPVLRPLFKNPGTLGVTVNGEYIAILKTNIRDEYEDTLKHELVHAYITLASPKPLPFWFQEGSAVHFSMNQDRKFYGQPEKDKNGVMVGRVIELPEEYKQKLQSFHYLIEKVGEKKFYRWYKNAVETGDVDARPLLGLNQKDHQPPDLKRPIPIWLTLVVGAVILLVLLAAYYSSRRNSDYY